MNYFVNNFGYVFQEHAKINWLTAFWRFKHVSATTRTTQSTAVTLAMDGRPLNWCCDTSLVRYVDILFFNFQAYLCLTEIIIVIGLQKLICLIYKPEVFQLTLVATGMSWKKLKNMEQDHYAHSNFFKLWKWIISFLPSLIVVFLFSFVLGLKSVDLCFVSIRDSFVISRYLVEYGVDLWTVEFKFS